MPPIVSKPKDTPILQWTFPFLSRSAPAVDCMGSSCHIERRTPAEVLCGEIRRDVWLGVAGTAVVGGASALFARNFVQTGQDNQPIPLWSTIGAGVGAAATGVMGVATWGLFQTYRQVRDTICAIDRARDADAAPRGQESVTSPMDRVALGLGMAVEFGRSVAPYALANYAIHIGGCHGLGRCVPDIYWDDEPPVFDFNEFNKLFGWAAQQDRRKRAAVDKAIDDWVATGDGDMWDLGLKDAAFGISTADLCLGAAVLTRGCTPQRHTQRVYTFSTDVQTIQRQQLLIGAGLVAPYLAVYAVPAVASAASSTLAGASEWLAPLFQWVRPLVSVP